MYIKLGFRPINHRVYDVGSYAFSPASKKDKNGERADPNPISRRNETHDTGEQGLRKENVIGVRIRAADKRKGDSEDDARAN